MDWANIVGGIIVALVAAIGLPLALRKRKKAGPQNMERLFRHLPEPGENPNFFYNLCCRKLDTWQRKSTFLPMHLTCLDFAEAERNEDSGRWIITSTHKTSAR